ncbi:hypothetical protein F5148DRAFT_1163753 [Russula earlei]|uniref:Uncharacterized protein n=1 Tax=Russula earlei TaxID=71964 RepID=A0ACC0UM35_9AGAM|nr:hypothetical protein F5148DRAFT_1163753 [Russula earlei]
MDKDSHVGIDSNWTAFNPDSHLTPYLLRHITRIQVRNFTPFPARDAFASALTQPSEQSQFTSYGSLSDDLDVALARKRSRKLSSTSIVTVKGQGLEDHTNEESRSVGSMMLAEPRVRKRTTSRVSTRDFSTSVGSGSHPPLCGTGMASKTNHPRTLSVTSSTSGKGIVPSITLWRSHTQCTLEKALRSRLVETFITVMVPSGREQASLPSKLSTRGSPPSSRDHRSRPRASPVTKSKFRSTQSPSSRSTLSSREELTKRVTRTGIATSTDSPAPKRTSSTRRVITHPTKLNGNASNSASLASQVEADYELPTVPNFISVIHSPSTNPDFSMDFDDFSKWTDPSATHITVQLWAKSRQDSPSEFGNDRGEKIFDDDSDSQWRMAGKWDVCLIDLVPFSDEMSIQTSGLPSNTLLLTLSPPGKTFYLPVARSWGPTRSPSPSDGYASDPEVHTSGNPLSSRSSTPHRKDISLPKTKTLQFRASYAASSTWQDLFKLVNLQSAIVDMQRSLSKAIGNLDALFVPSDVKWLIREISEREVRVADWQAAEAQVRVEVDGLSGRIRHRKEELNRRREALNLATSMLTQDVATEAIKEQELLHERESTMALQHRLLSVRVSLITTLASLFPIDLISGSDLLFSILSVPLPIPLGVTDPAPPLSVPAYKEVNEESVATALGFAAFVVQLLASYLDRILVYPITFCGSRSMIRDGISAMVGPRMFPLFSRGVDTYRFEYGVFLLNKNIEMLMSDRDLRALDMRHTLPNLKNLLLTLSDEEGAKSGVVG